MNNLIRFSLLVSLLCLYFIIGCSNPEITTTEPAKSITILKPSTIDACQIGLPVDIRWESKGIPGKTVNINLYNDSAFIDTIGFLLENDGTHTWAIPQSVKTGLKFRIKITCSDDAAIFDYSDYFTIRNDSDNYEPDDSASRATSIDTNNTTQAHTISVADTDWYTFDGESGRTYCIQTTGDANTEITLYAINSKSILKNDTNSGQKKNALILWTCQVKGKYFFKVTSQSDKFVTGYTVSVKAGGEFLTLINPSDTALNLSSGDSLDIKWVSSVRVGDNISWQLYNSDTLITSVGSVVYNSGRYGWKIPGELPTSSKYRIRLISINDSSINTMSTAFSITKIPASIKITTPSAATVWNTGNLYNIYWASSGNLITPMAIYLYDSSSLAATIATNIRLSTETYKWSIPANLPSSKKYSIRIVSMSDSAFFTTSNQFSIEKEKTSIKLQIPASASNWNVGSSCDIYWTSTGSSNDSINISLYDTLNSFIATITSEVSLANGSFSWSIPANLSPGKYKLKITSTTDTSLYTSSSVFTISKVTSTITLTKPTAASVLSTGSFCAINWSYTGIPGSSATIVLYDSTSNPLYSIVNSISVASLSYRWSIPSKLQPGKYKIGIYSTTDTSVNAISPLLTITKGEVAFTFTTPTATTSWNSGSSNSISWSTTGNPETYAKLTLHDSASQLISTLSTSLQAIGGSFNFSIPSALATGKYKLKIASLTDTTIWAYSPLFTITKTPSTLSITTPSTSTKWNTGTTNLIYWSSTGNPGDYISLTLCDSILQPVMTIASKYSRSGIYYSWNIPLTVPVGKYKIMIASTTDTSVKSYSGLVTIEKLPSTITLLTPSALTSWITSTSYYIDWTYTGAPGTYASIFLCDSLQKPVMTITSSVSISHTTYYWSIPTGLPNGKYCIKISSTTDTSVSSTSVLFPITKIQSTLTIFTPATTTNWAAGASNSILWSYTGNPGSYVSLMLYDSLSQPVTTISSTTELSNGSYTWLIPSSIQSSMKYRIRIASTTDTSVYAFSSPFTISKPSNFITLTIPSATNNWPAGSLQTIFWSYTGNPCSYVTLSLYNGTTFSSTITTSTNLTTGYYAWTVPSTLTTSSEYRIRISCTTDTTDAGYSNYFTITGN